jgi:hypothetical protein
MRYWELQHILDELFRDTLANLLLLGQEKQKKNNNVT